MKLPRKSATDRYISPRFLASQWRSLDLSKSASPDWETAVDMFIDRLDGRFLAPIAAIRRHPDLKISGFAGFTVIAIDCLIIETLVQFWRGENETMGPHEEAFVNFFATSRFFRREFKSGEMSRLFYRHFRCGILHQAQTKGRSLVQFGLEKMVDWVDPFNHAYGLVLDRELFHDALLAEVNDYAQRLRGPTSSDGAGLRRRFVQKMGFIAR